MTLYLVTLIALLNQIGFGGSRIAIALYALHLGANAFSVGLIVAAYSLCPMLLAITIGKLASRSAPRPIMIIGAVATVVALLLPPVFTGMWTLYAAALLLGLSPQVFSSPLEVIVGGIGGAENRTRNYSVISMGWSLANFIGPIVAGIAIDHLGILYGFWVLAAIAAAPIFLLWFMPGLFPKAPVHAAGGSHGHSVFDLWRLPPLRTTIIAGGLVGSAKDLFQFYMPVYGHAIELSASAIGTIMGMSAFASFVIRGAIPWVVKHLTETQILTGAIFMAALSFVLIPFFVNPYVLSMIAFLLGLGVGSAEPIMLSLFYALSPRGRMAEALGLFKTARNATQILVPIAFGSLGAALGYTAVFLTKASMLVVSGWMTSKLGVPSSDSRSP